MKHPENIVNIFESLLPYIHDIVIHLYVLKLESQDKCNDYFNLKFALRKSQTSLIVL